MDDKAPVAPSGPRWRFPAWLALVLTPVALASALVYRARIDWAYCLAAAEGSAPRHPTPGLVSSEVLAAMVPDSWVLLAIIALAFAGPATLAILPGRGRIGLVGWALVFAGLLWLLHDPSALHDCDREGTEGEFLLLLLLPAGWGFTLAASLFARSLPGRQSR